ncbi:EAL domain-containing protein [Cytobacillus oceanisediminis]|uniref:EAL domain-containing protein n=1 Tax=Cytobacillus oceanisediminis TaxID=665099 RepID=UPI00203B8774|nr:EAL domain-containing protein [Cytobacillus oceanisediminis]MCM3403687.1 EAL domain-containing protein [Cytobacillus oceanisediminis]MDK7666807.1 EAL domain-containing protein [Cytobacillus oceanisediminis]
MDEINSQDGENTTKDTAEYNSQQMELTKIKDNLNQAQKIANIGSLEYDVENDRGFWSDQLFRIFGLKSQKGFFPDYRMYLSYLHPDDRPAFEDQFQKLLKEMNSVDLICRIIRQDGEERYIHQRANYFAEDSGSPKIIATIQDITEKRRMEEKLYENERKIGQIYENLDVGIYSADLIERKVFHFSRGVEGIFGYTADELIDNFDLWDEVIHPDDLQSLEANRVNLIHGKSIRCQYRIFNKSGELRWVNDHSIPYLDERGELIRVDGFVTDITEQKRLEEKMRHMAFYDHLTDLPNRRYFDQKLQSLVKDNEKHRFAVLFFDLERLKQINDTFGHSAGDELLRLVAKRIREKLNVTFFSARISGDQFAVIKEHIQEVEDPAQLGDCIYQIFSDPFHIESFELKITPSIGISIYPNNGVSAEEMVRNTETSLYHAKQKGKNRFQVYHPSMDIESYKLFTLEQDMRKALVNDEFILEYQPRVDTKTGKILSAEALLRWSHPEWGRVSPLEFIPVAEESGFIINIGEYVIRKVCRQLFDWKEKGLSIVPISVNISPLSFLKNSLVSMIKEALDEYHLEAELIEIELTESSLINYSENVISVLKELGSMGVKIALDDFGTGYSSITQLKNYKFDVLKIDKTFIQAMDKTAEDAIITANLIQLAHGLNMKVVAEGVETFEQFYSLRKNECDQIQGYLFSKPIPPSSFEQKLLIGTLKPQNIKEDNVFKGLRKYVRIEFPYPLEAEMTILELNSKPVKMGSTKILIEDMSAGGVKFASKMKLPVRKDIILLIETKLLGEVLAFTGTIVRKDEISDTLTNYGFQFIIEEGPRAELAGMLDTLQVQLEQNPSVPESRFIETASSQLYFE